MTDTRNDEHLQQQAKALFDSSVEQLDASPEHVTLRFVVEDTGPGIPAAAQVKLFEEFHQMDSSDSTRHGGSGLGLAICKGLTDLMDGRIGVESTPDIGSRFWVDIPFLRAEGPRQTSERDTVLPLRRGLAVGFEKTYSLHPLTHHFAVSQAAYEAEVEEPVPQGQ